MNRREFLKLLAGAGAAVAVAPLLKIADAVLPEPMSWELIAARTRRVIIPALQDSLYKTNPLFTFLSKPREGVTFYKYEGAMAWDWYFSVKHPDEKFLADLERAVPTFKKVVV